MLNISSHFYILNTASILATELNISLKKKEHTNWNVWNFSNKTYLRKTQTKHPKVSQLNFSVLIDIFISLIVKLVQSLEA